MKFLIVSQRYLGDCLLAAALAPAIKTHFPDSRVDLLTFRDNAPILEGISAIDRIVKVDRHPSRLAQAREHLTSWNCYDWAILAMTSTRTVFYSYFAAKRHASVRPSSLWMKLLLSNLVPYVPGQILHQERALLAPILGHPAELLRPVCPDRPLSADLEQTLAGLSPYVVCHCEARYQDKDWRSDKWRELFRRLLDNGKSICLTGGKGDADAINALVQGFPKSRVISVAGRATFGQTARIIRQAVAYVGVDTATTHVAAATGVPCICLYGPTPVREWGPAPAGGSSETFSPERDLETIENVTLVRRDGAADSPCTGCTRHICAHHEPPELSRCMGCISVDKVWHALCAHAPILG